MNNNNTRLFKLIESEIKDSEKFITEHTKENGIPFKGCLNGVSYAQQKVNILKDILKKYNNQ